MHSVWHGIPSKGIVQGRGQLGGLSSQHSQHLGTGVLAKSRWPRQGSGGDCICVDMTPLSLPRDDFQNTEPFM